MDLILRPFFLGGLFKLTGNQAPFTIPAKEKYLKKDWQRNSAYFQVPLKIVKVYSKFLQLNGGFFYLLTSYLLGSFWCISKKRLPASTETFNSHSSTSS